MSTKVAITSQDKQTVSGHVGVCNHFFLYEIDEEGNFKKQSLDLAENQILKYSFHDDPSPNPVNPLFDVDFLFGKEMGAGAVKNLEARNVKAFSIEEENPDIAIQKLIEGNLEAYVAEEHAHEGGCGGNCGGNHHH